jgi:amidase
MARAKFDPTVFHNALGAGEDVLSVADGDTIVTTTIDARGFDAGGVQRQRPPNPMTGPFHVTGAEIGDGLEIEIVRMTANRGEGWTIGSVAPNVVDPAFVAQLPERQQAFWRLDAEAGRARLVDPPPALAGWSVPFRPMLGCFGVAPAYGQAISTATSGPYGGNMDYRRLGPGSKTLFPVARPGAGVYLGDGHFVQGDGEIVGTGIETSFEVEFTVRIRKGLAPHWPRGEDDDFLFTIGNARPLDQALQHATTEMLRWLGEDFGLDLTSASHLLGQTVRYDVANVFNPAYSVACRLAKADLAAFSRRRS